MIDNVRCECIQRYVFRLPVLVLSNASLGRGVNTMAHPVWGFLDFPPAPSAMPRAM